MHCRKLGPIPVVSKKFKLLLLFILFDQVPLSGHILVSPTSFRVECFCAQQAAFSNLGFRVSALGFKPSSTQHPVKQWHTKQTHVLQKTETKPCMADHKHSNCKGRSRSPTQLLAALEQCTMPGECAPRCPATADCPSCPSPPRPSPPSFPEPSPCKQSSQIASLLTQSVENL